LIAPIYAVHVEELTSMQRSVSILLFIFLMNFAVIGPVSAQQPGYALPAAAVAGEGALVLSADQTLGPPARHQPDEDPLDLSMVLGLIAVVLVCGLLSLMSGQNNRRE
jgi:small neutral amino acid transporter SnatA (MarC family)